MSSSRFWELTVGVPADLAEGLTNLAWERGALGVVGEERPGRGPRLRAFFPGTVFASALEASVREYLDGLRELGFEPATGLSVVALADENWADAWRAHFTPRPVGRRLLIAPPWDRPAAHGRTVITIEPGRAFGTGHHGSTVGRLEETRAPLVVANLLSAAHRRFASQYERSLLPGGTLLLGGILDGEAADVAAALGGHGFVPRKPLSVEGWTTLELRAPLHDHA